MRRIIQKPKLDNDDIVEIRKKMDEKNRIITLKDFCSMFAGTIVKSHDKQIIVGNNFVKVRINCDNEVNIS